MRLGEALVRDGVITQAALEEALRAQIDHGGKLGATLVQLGFIDQAQLYHYLSRRFVGAHIFKPGEEPPVARDAVAAVPKKIAEYYRLVPIKMDATSIHIATLDPTRLSALSAVSTATKKKVVPHVVSDDVIETMLHRYYNIEPPRRSVHLPRAPIELPLIELPLAAQPQLSGTLSREDLFGTRNQMVGDPDDDLPLAEASDLLEEIVDDDGLAFDIDTEIETRPVILPLTFESAKLQINEATRAAEIAGALMGATVRIFSRAALFRVHAGAGTGPRVLMPWEANGPGVDRNDFDRVNLRVEPRSVFGVILSGRAPFLGNVARTNENSALYHALNWTAPRSAFGISLWHGSPIALLYADNGGDSLASINASGIVELSEHAASRLAVVR